MDDNEELDKLDQLRKAVGAEDSRPVVAGAAFADTFEERQREYEQEMKLLHEGGADYHGREGFRETMRRLGR